MFVRIKMLYDVFMLLLNVVMFRTFDIQIAKSANYIQVLIQTVFTIAVGFCSHYLEFSINLNSKQILTILTKKFPFKPFLVYQSFSLIGWAS